MKKIILVVLALTLAVGIYLFLAQRQNKSADLPEATQVNSDPSSQVSGENLQPQTQRPNTPEQNMYSAASALKPSPALSLAGNAKEEWQKCFPDLGDKMAGQAWKNLDDFFTEAQKAAGGVESEDLLFTEKTFKTSDGIIQRLKFTSDKDREGNLLVRMQLFSKKGEGWEEISIPREEQENPDPNTVEKYLDRAPIQINTDKVQMVFQSGTAATLERRNGKLQTLVFSGKKGAYRCATGENAAACQCK